MRKIEKESLLPRYYQLEQILVSRIKRMKPGSRLPSVQDLKKEYGLSQATTDKALASLTKKGFIVSEKGKGTFVRDFNSGKDILWICGRDIFSGDISPYYTHSFQCCADELKKEGYNLSPLIWEDRKDASFDFDTYRNYSGYIFISCEPAHPLLNQVKINRLPYVHMSNDFFDFNTIVADVVQGLKMAVEHFSMHVRKHGYVTVIGSERSRAIVDEVRRTLPPQMEFRFFGVDYGTKIREVTRIGYETAKEIFSKGVSSSSLFVMDDILALGVTNAIFELPYEQILEIDLLVRGSGQIPIPFPRPITYLSISPEDEAHVAVQMLLKRIASDGKNMASQKLGYALLNVENEKSPFKNSPVN